MNPPDIPTATQWPCQKRELWPVGKLSLHTCNRRHVHNSSSFAMYAELESACGRIASDSSIRVVTFRRAGGKAFVAGTDIRQFRDFGTEDDALEYEKHIEKIVGAVESLD